MGAGRSGTTALATFLGNAKGIHTVGEMHQFYEHLEENKTCPYGEPIKECSYWSGVIKKLPEQTLNSKQIKKQNHTVEHHKNIIPLLFGLANRKNLKDFIATNEEAYDSIHACYKQKYILDSSKYIGRALALKKSSLLNLKIIYVVRDPRGVIWSFRKKVQTSRTPLRTAGYYLIINILGELVYRFSNTKILKVRYEDLANDPEKCLNRISDFIKLDLTEVSDKINKDRPFEMPHIIGGNRLKKQSHIKFRRDVSWRSGSTFLKVFYYVLLLPLNLINRYKP